MNPKSHPPAGLVQTLAVTLLVWFGLNALILAGVSFVVFALLNRVAQAAPETAFTYALVCAIPTALTASSIVAGRRLQAALRKPKQP